MDKKDYQNWMKTKARIHNDALKPSIFKKGEIWVCNVGENVGHENDGKGVQYTRPVLIIQKYGNMSCPVLPLSATQRRGYYYFPFDGHSGKTSVALLTQSRIVDASRLRRKIGYVDKNVFVEIQERLKQVLGL
ncbi:MAG: type II toxin-antitoxin system PemK/MazF family toxin [Coriobacteriales bacterium]|jgi:mRNA-degrading endonuclease toxin of MazEF toxin-antitoxin module|nr:type II toxin-antitoxin system PemK/MazF family toxin [Coriobacteriales bacterium]